MNPLEIFDPPAPVEENLERKSLGPAGLWQVRVRVGRILFQPGNYLKMVFVNTLSKLHYGFLDESGILEKKAKEGKHFVVSVVVVGNPTELKDEVNSRPTQFSTLTKKTRGSLKSFSMSL